MERPNKSLQERRVVREMRERLDKFWADPFPDWEGRPPQRIAGSPCDQLSEGIQNPYWEIVRNLPVSGISLTYEGRYEPDVFYYSPGSPERYVLERGRLCKVFSWAIPSPGDLLWIRDRLCGRRLVETGAGLGYWAWQLAQAGVEVTAYDAVQPADNKYTEGEEWWPVLPGDHDAVKEHHDRSLLLCWPSYDEPWAAWSLASYQGDQLFYLGEGWGGCCANDAFFELLDAEWDEAGYCPYHVTYNAIHCTLREFRRKSPRWL